MVRGRIELPTFRFSGRAFPQVGARCASVRRCRWPPLVGVGRCCCCHRCCHCRCPYRRNRCGGDGVQELAARAGRCHAVKRGCGSGGLPGPAVRRVHPTNACASAGEPPPLASTSPPRALMCPGSLPTSTVPSAHARLSGSWESNPVTAVVGQRIARRSAALTCRCGPSRRHPDPACCATSAPFGVVSATVVFAARHPGPVLVIAFAGGGGCGAASDIYGAKIVVRSR